MLDERGRYMLVIPLPPFHDSSLLVTDTDGLNLMLIETVGYIGAIWACIGAIS